MELTLPAGWRLAIRLGIWARRAGGFRGSDRTLQREMTWSAHPAKARMLRADTHGPRPRKPGEVGFPLRTRPTESGFQWSSESVPEPDTIREFCWKFRLPSPAIIPLVMHPV